MEKLRMMSKIVSAVIAGTVMVVALLSIGCSSNDTKTSTPVPQYAVAGVVSGLSGTVVLQNNAADKLTLTANGVFMFDGQIESGQTYSVTVLTNPAAQICTLANPSGTIDAKDVTNIVVTCASSVYNVGGVVSGLSGSVAIRNNGGDIMTIAANGDYTFAGAVANLGPFAVTVLKQPAGKTCVVSNATGTVNGADIEDVDINCVDQPYAVAGTVSGLIGNVVLQNNGQNNLTITSNGTFVFSNLMNMGEDYAVSVLTQPDGQTCTVANATGTIGGADVTNIAITCASSTYTVGGSVSGLSGTVVLQNNNGDDLTVSSGIFTFTSHIANIGPYSVKVLAQPMGQTCTVANGSGTVAGANVSNVVVTCSPSTSTHTVSGTVSGLTGTVVLQNNGNNNLTLSSNGTFTFSSPVANISPYAVSILYQPATQACTVSTGTGTVSGANVTNVAVTCTDAVVYTYNVGGNVSGLSGSVALQNNGKDNLVVLANGSFVFPAPVANNGAYLVTVLTQPTGQLCLVVNGSGAVVSGNVTNVSVNCKPVPVNTGSAIKLPKTGRTICISSTGAVISCTAATATGQDGALQKGITWPNPRFTNPDGTTPVSMSAVVDKLTGLMWTKYTNSPGPSICTPDVKKTWQAGLDHIKCLNDNNYLGYNDWRMPNIVELKSPFKYDIGENTLNDDYVTSWLFGQGFITWQYNAWEAYQHWSSTSIVGKNYAYAVSDMTIVVSWLKSTISIYVWPVRGGQGGTIELPKTGQTECYDSAGAVIACANTGQDGDLQKGVAWPNPRFTNLDGTTPLSDNVVKDQLTGLIWTKEISPAGPVFCTYDKTWQSALDYVQCLNNNNFLGYNDWRMPNILELGSLNDYSKAPDSGGKLLPTGVFLNEPTYLFQSTTYNGAEGVWPVRGGQ